MIKYVKYLLGVMVVSTFSISGYMLVNPKTSPATDVSTWKRGDKLEIAVTLDKKAAYAYEGCEITFIAAETVAMGTAAFIKVDGCVNAPLEALPAVDLVNAKYLKKVTNNE